MESPNQLRKHIESLSTFRSAYTAHLTGGPEGSGALRRAVIDAIPRAQEALNASGMDLVVIDPPALGSARQAYEGLANTAFLHERPGFRTPGLGGGPTLCDNVIDTIDQGSAQLVNDLEVAERLRRRPLYWFDRAVRLLLAIPAYIVSRVVGTSVVRVERSAWGLPLRCLAVVADAFAVYLGGQHFGWW